MGLRLPSFSNLPGPVRTTRPLIGLSLAEEGSSTPPVDTSACSWTWQDHQHPEQNRLLCIDSDLMQLNPLQLLADSKS